MNDEQAEKIIKLLDSIDNKLSELSSIKSHLHGLEDDVEDIKVFISENAVK